MVSITPLLFSLNLIFASTPQASPLQIPSEVFEISMLILVAEVSALGVVYALSKAFDYPKLTAYVRAELTQVAANILIVAFSVGAFNMLYSTDTFKNSYDLIRSLTFAPIGYASKIFLTNFLFSTLMSVSLDLTVRIGFGALIKFGVIGEWSDIQLADGFQPVFDAFDVVVGSFSTVLILSMALSSLLAFITALLPFLFYLGLIFRAIPWTRSVGGYLISAFLSFYLMFPLLLSFFSGISPGIISLKTSFSLSSIVSDLSTAKFGELFSNMIEWGIAAFASLIVSYWLPIILSGIITLMFMDELASLLGGFITTTSLFRIL